MHETLTSLQEQLAQVVTKFNTTITTNEPLGIIHNNWSFVGLTRDELAAEAQSIIDLIYAYESDDLGDAATLLQDYIRRIKFLHENTIPNLWANANTAVPAYLLTIQALRKYLTGALVKDDHAEAVAKLHKLTIQVRNLETRLKSLEPRTTSLAEMVSRIENVHEAANQFPTDLETLDEDRKKLQQLMQNAIKSHGHIEDLRINADNLDQRLRQSTEDAKSVLERLVAGLCFRIRSFWAFISNRHFINGKFPNLL